MLPQRFVQSYICECFQPYNYCNCPNKSRAGDILLENAKQVAQTLTEVMQLCGIAPRKATRSTDVVLYYLLHFDEIRYRIDSVPKKHVFKEDLLHDLHRKCDMTRLEAQKSYTIVKRAFRAFYHGTGEGGVPRPLLYQQLVHTPACMWIHASKRTAQIMAAYEGMFLATQKDIECKIKQLYKDLYERINQTELTEGNHECSCLHCAKRIMRESLKTVRVTTRMHGIADPYEEMYSQIVNEMERDLANGLGNLENEESRHCSCPSLKMSDSDYMYQQTAESCNTGYSQGPYDCHWAPISKEEYEADDTDPIVSLPEEYPCPPCSEDASSCDSECQCTCEVCTCESDNDFECAGEAVDLEDDKESHIMETEEENAETVTGIESADLSEKQFSLKYAGCRNPTKILEMLKLQGNTIADLNSTNDHRSLKSQTRGDSLYNTPTASVLDKAKLPMETQQTATEVREILKDIF